MNTNWTEYLQRRIEDDIAPASAMGIRVVEATPSSVHLIAPLNKNSNHCNQGFAGSIYSVFALSGWGLATIIMEEQNICDYRAVLADASIKYLRPVTENLSVQIHIDPDIRQRFIDTYRARKRASVVIEGCMYTGSQQRACTFTGKFACVAEK